MKRPVRPMPKVSAGVSVNDMDLLEVTFNMKDLDFSELMDILDSYRAKRRYHRLKDKTFVTLEEQQMQAIADFVENVGITRQGVRDLIKRAEQTLTSLEEKCRYCERFLKLKELNGKAREGDKAAAEKIFDIIDEL